MVVVPLCTQIFAPSSSNAEVTRNARGTMNPCPS